MNDLQSPSIHFWQRNYDPSKPNMHVSARRGPMSDDMHVRAWLDERQRIMILALHNCDNGDGWEREGQNEEYFHLFSESGLSARHQYCFLPHEPLRRRRWTHLEPGGV